MSIIPLLKPQTMGKAQDIFSYSRKKWFHFTPEYTPLIDGPPVSNPGSYLSHWS